MGPQCIEALYKNGVIPALISASPSNHPRSSSELSKQLSLAPPSRRPSLYLHGFCAMILHRGALFLVKWRSLVRRLSAPRPSFVAPTGLRCRPRLRPRPRLDLRPRQARYGFPSPVASFRSCPTTTHTNFAFQPFNDRLPRTPPASPSPLSPSSSRSALAPSAPDPRPHANAIIAIHNVISILSIILSYLCACAAPPASSPGTCTLPVRTLDVLLQLRSLPSFCGLLVLVRLGLVRGSVRTRRAPPSLLALHSAVLEPDRGRNSAGERHWSSPA